jgi:cysteine synthase A
MRGAVQKAEELAAEKGCYIPMQFQNPANPEAHRRTTGPEIVQALNGQTIDGFAAGVGTGGTLTGVGEVLRSHNPAVRIAAVEPTDSSVLSGGEPGPHKIQGIGAGFIPDVLNRKIFGEIITVANEDAYATTRRLARECGILVGISAGANVWAAQKMAQSLGKGKNVVTILCDTGERYLSTGVFD